MSTDTKGDWGQMTRLDEARFRRKLDNLGHRGLQNGRDFRWNVFRYRDENPEFCQRFDRAFPAAPGGPEWFEKRFCPVCGKNRHYCLCERQPNGRRANQAEARQG